MAVYRQAIALAPVDPQKVDLLRQEQILQSALFSARIEGSPLTQETMLSGKKHHQLELERLMAAYGWVYQARDTMEPMEMVKHLHRLSMSGIDPQPGVFRKEQTAIFTQAGVAVYITPPAAEIEERLQSLFGTLKKSPGPVTADAALAHIWFEKIHPFIDGNGRVGRLLMAYWLQVNDLGFDGLLAVEKIIEKRKSEYYDLLAPNVAEVTPFVEFMGECLVETAKALMDQLKEPQMSGPEDDLMPRQREMYLIIKDHREVSFDFIRRRFLSVPKSTLHYDLKQLMKKELVKKIGVTRGSRYRLKEYLI